MNLAKTTRCGYPSWGGAAVTQVQKTYTRIRFRSMGAVTVAKNKSSIPKFWRQRRKSGDLAFIELDGRRHYLEKYELLETSEKYHRLISE